MFQDALNVFTKLEYDIMDPEIKVQFDKDFLTLRNKIHHLDKRISSVICQSF